MNPEDEAKMIKKQKDILNALKIERDNYGN